MHFIIGPISMLVSTLVLHDQAAKTLRKYAVLLLYEMSCYKHRETRGALLIRQKCWCLALTVCLIKEIVKCSQSSKKYMLIHHLQSLLRV